MKGMLLLTSRNNIVLSFLILFSLLYVCSGVFTPFVVTTPKYRVVFPVGWPKFEISSIIPNTNSTEYIKLLTFTLESMEEVHSPEGTFNFTTGDEFSEKFNANQIVIGQINSTDIPWNVSTTLTSEFANISFSAKLTNGAEVSVDWTLNLAYDIKIPIPHKTSNCSIKNRFANGTCDCNPTHNLIQDSLKYSFTVKQWPFTWPQTTNSSYTVLRVSNSYDGPFNIEYYYSLTDYSQFAIYSVCDVITTPLYFFPDFRAAINFTYFTLALIDNRVTSIFSSFQKKSIKLLPGGEFRLPIDQIYPPFFNSLYYDPDFSVFFPSKEQSVPGGGGGGGGGDGSPPDSNSYYSTGKDNQVRDIVIIVVVVVVGMVVIFVLVGAIIAFVLFRMRVKGRQPKKTMIMF